MKALIKEVKECNKLVAFQLIGWGVVVWGFTKFMGV